jgi:dihydroorotate dehydrogenase
MQATYDVTKSTAWNQEHGPIFKGEIPVRAELPTKTKLWDFELNSPLGIPAGPLFNSKFIKLYADLGFDVLTYKTVRSIAREAHPNPNIVFVDISKGVTPEDTIYTRKEPSDISELTITNSYGVNSLTIPEWQADFAKAQAAMHDGQLLVLSCMGTHGIERELTDDYAYTAAAAKDAGAKAIELNLSCPNLKGARTGAIYLDPETSSTISRKVKEAIGNIPLIIKVAHYADKNLLSEILAKNAPYVDGVAAINTIKMRVNNPDGTQALPGEGRETSGLCGTGIKPFGIQTIQQVSAEKETQGYDFEIIGMGGVVEPKDIDDYLDAGAKVAMSGAGSMWEPLLAWKYNQYKL